MKKTFCIVILIIFFSGNKVLAEDISLKKLDFREAVLIALENNNEIHAIKNSLSASERDIGIARSVFFPKVRVGEDFEATNNPSYNLAFKLNQRILTTADIAGAPNSLNNPGTITNFLTYGAVIVPLFGRAGPVAYKIAKTQYSANGYFYLRKQEDLIKNVALAYLAIATAQEYLIVAEQNLEETNEHIKITNAKYREEKGLYSDFLRATTEVTEAEQKLVSAQKKLDVAKRDLGLLLGLKDPVEISNVSPTLDLNPIDYYKAFSQYRTDVKAMEINVKNAKNGVELAKADWWPVMYGIASYNFYNGNYPFAGQGNYIAGVFLSWTVFDGNKRIYETLKAKDKVKEAEEYLELLRKNADFKIFEAYSGVEESNKNYELAKIALNSAEECESFVSKRFKDSKTSFVDVLYAQANLNKARENLVKNRNEIKSQLINLYHESGIIRQELEL